MLKLSKTQEKLAKRKNIGHNVIKGIAGSGKTAVAIARMLYLREHVCKPGEKVLMITTTPDKKQWIESCEQAASSSQNMSLFEEAKGEAVIKIMDELIEEAADKAHVHLNLKVMDTIPEAVLLDAIQVAKKQYPSVKWLKKEQMDFIQQEIIAISQKGLLTLEAYQMSDRKGALMKLPKKGSGRQAMWLMKNQISEQLKAQGMMLKSQMQLDTLQYLKEDALRSCYAHLIIDEAQDLTKTQLDFIQYLKAQGPGEVLFFVDTKSHVNFKAIGYNMTGRVKRLVTRKKAHKEIKHQEALLTPLELWLQEQVEKKESHSTMPWYVETYQYINKATGVVTVFQKDSSAGETYIDEVKQEDVQSLPVYSDIAAGLPIEIVDEENSTFEIPGELLHHKKQTYMLQVQGDSMIGADISDGDYVVIQAGGINTNEIAAVYYNGATTLKRIVQHQGQILLCSENPKYDPIVIEEGDFRVMGKLVGVIKALS